MHIREAISSDLDIPESLIEEAMSVSRTHVKIFNIPKRDGSYRQIFHPSKKLKTIQYWLIRNIFNHLPIHNSAYAFREGYSILDNAKVHSENTYFLKMDLKDFFPCIKYSDLQPIIEKWHKDANIGWDLDEEGHEIINKSCFYKGDQLAVGYTSSPIISNIVMYDFDISASALISNKLYGDMLYTRYADDFVFSTKKRNVCKKVKKEIIGLVSNCKKPDISVNHGKTKLGSSTGGSASVTGLKVCANGHVTIRRKQKDHIRLLLSLYTKGVLRADEHVKLIGHLSYCRHVAPSFYTSLSKKYFKEIYELRKK